MEPLHNPNEGAPRPNTYAPKRSRWPGLVGAAAVVAAVIGVAMWGRHDDARKAETGPGVTAPAQTSAVTANPASSQDSQVATQPVPARP